MRCGLMIAVAAMAMLAGCESAAGEAIDRASFTAQGKAWPFTVNAGRIGCDDGAVWFEADGKRYALNGPARGRWPYADAILQVDETTMKTLRGAGDTNPHVVRTDPRDVRERARALCR